MPSAQVSIGGVEYTVRTALEPEKVAVVAKFVEQQLAKTALGAATGDSYRIAILTLLKIAGEYLELRSNPGKAAPDDEVLLGGLLTRIDAVLAAGATDKGSPQGDFR